ncbi:MAG: sugar transferase [Candidatus Aminicenantes bacterium]|nr:sugar transferase [Candidatus Aminicenantes bacterium]
MMRKINKDLKKIINVGALITADLVSLSLSFILAYVIRNNFLPLLFPHLTPTFPLTYYFLHSFLFILWLLVLAHEKLYTKRSPLWDEIRGLWKSTSICFFVVMILVFLARKEFFFSRLIILMAWIFSLLFLPAFRYFTKFCLLKLGLWQKSVLILGDGETTNLVIEGINRNRIMGYEIKGILKEKPEKWEEEIAGIPILGGIDDLKEICEKLEIRDFIIALANPSTEKIINLLKQGEDLAETIRIIPPTIDLITVGVEIDNLGTTLALSLKKNLDKKVNLILKMALEYLICFLLIILATPLMLIIAVAIKIDSKGPIFFNQIRLGKRGRPFKLMKFRSMYVEADEILEQYLAVNPRIKKEWEIFKKIRGYDPRVTRVGKILRRFSLDELPQLFNVLKGEMNLVGPRPYLKEEIEGLEPFFKTISKFRPGITGLWQISGRSDVPMEKRLILDEYYLRNWSLWLDFMISVRTIKAILTGKGAY